jgi:long-subunit fatty acid transport protein
MKVRELAVVGSLVVLAAIPARAGGLFLPGSGAVSTSRAGASVASADDGEALSINPAGLAKSHGTTITVSLALIRYFMQFTRSGTYDDASDDTQAYEGTKYPTIVNDPKPPLGIGKYQPIPVVALVTDLGGQLKNARIAVGLYAPSGYPFRDMSNGYQFCTHDTDPGTCANDLTKAPPPSRYDIMQQESALLLPSIAASYRLLPDLDVGARFTAGNVKSKTTVAVWGVPTNVEESIRNDSMFTADVSDSFIPTFGLGLALRPTPAIEIGFNYSAPISIRAQGSASSVSGPGNDPNRTIGPIPDAEGPSCATGGTAKLQKACISLQLPQTATLGIRYKFLGTDLLERPGNDETMRGDIELDLGWENWGKTCDFSAAGLATDPDCVSPGQYRVVIDSGIYTNGTYAQPLEKNFVNLGLQDTFSVRLGGSYRIPLGGRDMASANKVILRGGISYDTAAAKTGWLRSNFDGAARVATTLGAAYRGQTWELNVGGGMIHEGSPSNPGAGPNGTVCNPTATQFGCVGDGTQHEVGDRQGPDPTAPIIEPGLQTENPVNQGTYQSHYIVFMLGVTKWF